MSQNPIIQISVEELKQLLREELHTKQKEDQLFNIEEASAYLHLAKTTIYNLVSKGIIPYLKRSKKLYFSKIALSAWVREGEKPTQEEFITTSYQFLQRKK